MALAVRSNYASCFAVNSHFCHFLSHHQTGYRFLKTADFFLDASSEIAKASQAPKEVLTGLSGMRVGIGVVRDGLGLFHLFFRVIPALIYSLKVIWHLCGSFSSRKDVPLIPHKPLDKCAYNECAKGNFEKSLCLGYLGTGVIKAGTSIFATTVCQPLLYLQTTSVIPLGGKWESVANTHQTLITMKHASSLLGEGLEMAYHYTAFQRSGQEGDRLIFSKKMIELTSGVIENVLHLLYDIAKILQANLSASFRLPLVGALTAVGLYRTWLKSDPHR